MPTGSSTGLVDLALAVAARAHRNQARKGTDTPYIVHPVGVVFILQEFGFDDDHLLAAALLHDVVEDTDESLDSLREQFPQSVVDIVDGLTETKRTADGSPIPWEVRKQEHLERLRDSPPDVKAVALADKLHNLRSMQADLQTDPCFWDRFNAPRERILWYYTAALECLADECEPKLNRLIDECRRILGTF